MGGDSSISSLTQANPLPSTGGEPSTPKIAPLGVRSTLSDPAHGSLGPPLKDRAAEVVPNDRSKLTKFLGEKSLDEITSMARTADESSLRGAVRIFLAKGTADGQARFSAVIDGWCQKHRASIDGLAGLLFALQQENDVDDNSMTVAILRAAQNFGNDSSALFEALKKYAFEGDVVQSAKEGLVPKDVQDLSSRPSANPKPNQSLPNPIAIHRAPSSSRETPGQSAYGFALAGDVDEVKILIESLESKNQDEVRGITLGILQGIRNHLINPGGALNPKGSKVDADLAAKGDLKAGQVFSRILGDMGLRPEDKTKIMREAYAFFHDPSADSFESNIRQAFGLSQVQASEVVKSFRQPAEAQPGAGAKFSDREPAPRVTTPPPRSPDEDLDPRDRRPKPVTSPNAGSSAAHKTVSGPAALNPGAVSLDDFVARIKKGNAALEIRNEKDTLGNYDAGDLGLKLAANFSVQKKDELSSIATAILMCRPLPDDDWCANFFRGFGAGLKNREKDKGLTNVQHNWINQETEVLKSRLKNHSPTISEAFEEGLKPKTKKPTWSLNL